MKKKKSLHSFKTLSSPDVVNLGRTEMEVPAFVINYSRH